jgi:beta-lactamase regulating signal transducer with metallopeptidase domain
MNFLYQSAFAEALGWSLIDSLWQMGAIWVIYIIVTGNGTTFSSQKRHSLALLGSATGTLIFFISLALNYYSAVYNNGFFSLAYFLEKQSGNILMGYTFAEYIVPFISFLYLPAVIFFALKLMLQVSINKTIYRKNLVEANGNVAQFVYEMSNRSGISRKVTVWISEKVESPLTIGFWKPVILLPVAVFNHLSCSQVEAVLTHELYHIKRNDYLINIFLTVAEVIFFFNPFARMMFNMVKKERENSCDDHVIASGYDAWEYSEALYILGRYRNEKYNLAIAATGAGKEYLLQRIRRIMKRNNPSPSILKPFLAFFLCVFVAGFASRNKQIATVPQVALNTTVEPVVFYLEEKRIILGEPGEPDVKSPVTSGRNTKAPAPVKKIIIQKVLIPHEPELLPVELLSDEEIQDLLVDYVDAPQVLEFTIIDPIEPVIPEVICESPQPFIQKSSFYFTEVDTTAGNAVVEL